MLFDELYRFDAAIRSRTLVSDQDPINYSCCLSKCVTYITLSATGRLIAIDDWPTAGLALDYKA